MNLQPYYIVSRVVGKSLEPATTPRTYNTFRQARAVAHKLTEESGEHFVVLKAVFHTKPVASVGYYFEGCEE